MLLKCIAAYSRLIMKDFALMFHFHFRKNKNIHIGFILYSQLLFGGIFLRLTLEL